MRPKAIIAGLALAACSSPTDVGRPPGAVDVSIEFCLGEGPDWLAYKNEGRDWVTIPANLLQSHYTFPATPKVQIAFAHDEPLSGYSQVNLFSLTAQEAAQLRCPASLHGDKSLTGSVTRNHESDDVRVLMGNAADVLHQGTTTFSFGVQSGPQDLLAIRTATSVGALPTTLLIVRHGLDLPAGSAIPLLDFTSPEAQPIKQATVTVAGADAATLSTLVTFKSVHGTSFNIGFNSSTSGSTTVAGFPDAAVAAGDLHRLAMTYAPATGARTLLYYMGVLKDTTFTIGPAANVPVADVVSLSPVLPRARINRQDEYATLALATFQQTNGGALRVARVLTTAAYLGGAPVMWDLALADLSGIEGFQSSWRLVPDVTIGVSVQPWGGPAGLYFGGLAPTLGVSLRSATARTTYNF